MKGMLPRNRSEPTGPVHHVMVAASHFLETRLLFGREKREKLRVRLTERFSDASAGIFPDAIELRRHFVGDGPDLFHLFGR